MTGRNSIAASCLALAACAPEVMPSAELNGSYESALERTAPPAAAIFATGSAAETAAIERAEAFFASMTVASVRDLTRQVYAADAYLYDNIAAVSGAGAIEDYFAHAAGSAEELSVRFVSVAPQPPDYYVRWKMRIVAGALAGGEPVESWGVTQFRFDPQGRVLLHRDFWDAATGMYEHVPVLGGLVRRVRGRAAGGHGGAGDN